MRLADGGAGAAGGAGDGKGGDEGALALGRPAVDALLLAGDGGEIEEIAEGFEMLVAGLAGGAAAVAMRVMWFCMIRSDNRIGSL